MQNRLLLLGVALLLHFGLPAQLIRGVAASDRIEHTEMLRYADENAFPQYILLRDGFEQSFAEGPVWLNKNLGLPQGISFEVINDDIDRQGNRHVRLQQYFDGYEVKAGQIILHGRNDVWDHATGEIFAPDYNGTQVLLSPDQAVGMALDELPAGTYGWEVTPALADYPEARLVWVPRELKFNQNDFQLAYAVKVYAAKPLAHKTIYLDVATGDVLAKEEHIHTHEEHAHDHAGQAENDPPASVVPGTAITAYSGERPIETTLDVDKYILHDDTRGLGVVTYNCQTQPAYPMIDFVDDDNFWDNVNPALDEVATDAHWGTEAYYDYLLGLGRNSIDNNGELLQSHVHYDFQFANAFWDGTRMTYGDGAPGSILPLPLTSMDVVAHELTHGLTERTSALIYNDESGALNESFSDIFGATLNWHENPTQATWIIGADITLDGNGIRNMMDPNIHDDPGTYDGDFWFDGAGVHTNSGVQNHWYQLLVDGEVGTNELGFSYDLDPTALDTAAEIAYQNNAFYLTPSSNYQDAGFNSVLAAGNLYGTCSVYPTKVYDAWQAVNVVFGYPGIVSANFTLENDIICGVDDTVNFINTSFAENFHWDFGDGNTSTEQNPSHVYGAAGSYTVTLTAFGGACNNDTVTNVFPDAVVVDPNSIYCTSFFLDSDQTVEECSGVLFDSGGPDGSYGNNENFTFTIINPAGGEITLDLVFFETEANFDEVTIYDGPDASSPQIAFLDGVHTGESYSSTGSSITINFNSDFTVTRPGFEITWGSGQGTGPADAAFTASSNMAFISQPVVFTPTNPSSQELIYDFGDGSPLVNGDGATAHSYLAAGTYEVMAIDNNCTEQDTAILTIEVASGTTFSVDPDNICDTLFTGEMADHLVTITNTGTDSGYVSFTIPDLSPVSESSSVDYTGSGAMTTHVFADFPTGASTVTVTLAAFGDYDNLDENATLYLEGEELGIVGNGVGGTNDIYTLQVEVSGSVLSAAAADGELEFTVQNSFAVDDIIGTNHTVSINYSPAPFLSVDGTPAEGLILAPGESVTITVTLDASGLFPDTYLQSILINTSDSLQPIFDLPVKLRVLGTPIADYSTTFINFGTLFTNEAATEEFTILSVGTDTLVINSMTSTEADFATAQIPPFGIAALADSTIQLEFAGRPDAGFIFGQLQVSTNAGNQNINFVAEIVEAPVATISPDSICVTLNAGESLDTSIFMTNTGLSSLEYQFYTSYADSSLQVYEGSGAATDHSFTNLPPIPGLALEIIIQGDFDLAGEFVSIIINGVDYGPLEDNGLDNEEDILYFPLPPELIGATELNITLQNSNQVDDFFGYANRHEIYLRVENFEWFIFNSDTSYLGAGLEFNFPLTLDATNLNGGTYESTLFFASNDPQLLFREIPIKLIVIGTPELVIDPDTLDFGGVQLTTSEILTLRVFNPGSDVLEIESVTIASGQYAADQFNFSVPPDAFQDVNVIFAPSMIGELNTTLTLSGPTHNIVVPVLGTGLPVPQGALDRDTICVTLLEGETTVESMALSNSGQGILEYTTGLGGLGNRTLIWTYEVDPNSLDNMMTILADPNLLLDISTSASTNPAELTTLLETTDLLIIPDLDFVPFAIENEVGPVFRSWIEAGGRLIAVGNSNSSVSADMQLHDGTFHGTVFDDGEIEVEDDTHPLLEGVQFPLTIQGGMSYVEPVSNANNADVTEVVNRNVFANQGIIFTQTLGDGESVYLGFHFEEVTQNNEQILRNAIEYTRTEIPFPDWLTVDNTDGTLDPGASTDVNLTFDAGTLPGGTYTFPLTYSFNQPTNNLGLTFLKMIIATAPVANFSSPNQTSCDGTVNFFDESLQDPTSWEWDFGDGNTSTEQNPTHVYDMSGVYSVTLTACNDLGCNMITLDNYITVELDDPFCQTTVFEDNASVQLNGCGGIIFSTNHPGNYPNGVDSEIQITSGDGGPISITVNSFELEGCCDWLRAYDGPDANAPLIGQWNGFDLVEGDVFESTGDVIFLRFTTDGSVVRPGFELQWQCVNLVLPPIADFESPNELSCDGVVNFFDESQFNPDSWEWDFGDGNTSNAQNPVHTYTESGIYTVTLTVCNDLGCNTITKTDYILVDPENQGCFETVFEDNESQQISGCGGLLLSTNFPGNYPNGVSSDIQITSSAGPVTITVNSFQLEGCCDWLRAYDGPDNSANLIGQWNGTDLVPGDVIESTGNVMFLTFTTDGSVTLPGFELEWSCAADINNVILQATPEEGCPSTFRFEAINGLPSYEYSWDFGDGSGETGPGMHMHTYAATDTYIATLTVTDETGTATSQTTVDVLALNLPLGILGPDTVETNQLATFTKDGTDLLTGFDWSEPNGNTGTGEEYTTSWDAVGTYEIRLDASSDEVCPAAAVKTVVVVLGSNVNDADEVAALAIYPNPAGDILYFDLELSRQTQLQYSIMDAMGRRVLSSQMEAIPNNGPVSIDLSNLPSASYLLILNDEQGNRLASRRFVKR